MSVILLKFAPWIAGAIVLLGMGGWAGYHLNPYPARYQALQASDAIARAQGEEAVRTALTAQLAQAQEVTRNNQSAMVTLANQNAQTAADRDATLARVHRLEQLLALAAAAKPSAGHSVPEAGDRPSASGSSGDPGVDRAGELLIAARDECRRNANRLQALIAEITPQL
jgi:hypothetical protein